MLGNNLTLNGNGTLRFDLANVTTEGGGVNDLVTVGGNLSLGGISTIAINPIAARSPTAATGCSTTPER